MIERTKLIACLVGFFAGSKKTIDANSLRILIDQRLVDSNMGKLGSEEGDMDTLREVCDEVLMSVMMGGINRKTRRSI